MDLTVRRFDPADAEALAGLESICFSSPLSAIDLISSAAQPFAAYFTALAGDEITGYIGMTFAADEADIGDLAVFPHYRRCGVASALLDTAEDFCKNSKVRTIYLEVRRSNGAAIALYEKKGFINCGVRRNYYNAPTEDAILYSKEL